MKRFAVTAGAFCLLLCFSLGQEKDIREDVTVTNVEVPVRVFLKGEPVKGLKRSDFTLYEGRNQQEINGFYEVSKVIHRENVELSAEREERYRPRYFVLVFRIRSVPGSLKNSLSYLFRDIIRKEDQLLVFINNKTIFFKSLADLTKVYSLLLTKLKEEAVNERFRFEKYYQKVQQGLNQANILTMMETDRSAGMQVSGNVIIFLRNYLQIWNEYKKKYLIPDIDNYYNFSKFLEKIDMEKWVISFYQFEKFPELKLSGRFRKEVRDLIGLMQLARGEEVARSRIISKLLMDIDRALKVADDFPTEDISKLFAKVNTTFHSLFFSDLSGIQSQDLEFSEISTDLENTFRALTKKTGGELIVSNRLGESMKKVVREEDSYYVLTYSPSGNRKKGKIKVDVRQKGYEVVYDNNIRADYIEEYLTRRESEVSFITIENGRFEKRRLGFRIAGITLRKLEGRSSGRVRVHLLVKGLNGQKIYDKSRDLTTNKKEIDLNIGMNWLKSGEYDLTVDVTDILSGRSAFDYLKIKVK